MTEAKQAEAFIQAAIDSAPEPMRRLGEWLAYKLDDDDWKTADRLVTGAAVALKNEADKTQKLERELVESRAECERLREALRPFARVAEHDIGDDETDGDRFLPIVDRRHARAPLLTWGDLRRALAALKEPTDA